MIDQLIALKKTFKKCKIKIIKCLMQAWTGGQNYGERTNFINI